MHAAIDYSLQVAVGHVCTGAADLLRFPAELKCVVDLVGRTGIDADPCLRLTEFDISNVSQGLRLALCLEGKPNAGPQPRISEGGVQFVGLYTDPPEIGDEGWQLFRRCEFECVPARDMQYVILHIEAGSVPVRAVSWAGIGGVNAH